MNKSISKQIVMPELEFMETWMDSIVFTGESVHVPLTFKPLSQANCANGDI